MTFRAATKASPTAETMQRLGVRTGSEAPGRLQAYPVHPALAGLLPDGGLRPGAAYQVSGGALLLALLAEPSAAGSWCGVVGIPEFGAEAARSAGVALHRLALVPQPGERWLSVVAALAEVLPVVAVRPPSRVREADAARLAARLRERATVLLVCGEWPRAEARFGIDRPSWAGIGKGNGYLSGREVTVSVVSRHSPTPRTARLVLPDGAGRIASVLETAGQALGDGPTLRAVG